MEIALLLNNALEHRREEHQVDQLRIELRTAAGSDDVRGSARVPGVPVTTTVRDGVKGIGECDDAGGERNAPTLQPPRIPVAVPVLVMREHTRGKLWIEGHEWRQHLRAARGVGRDGLPLARRQVSVVVNDVEQRFVNLADVVKERDALDGASLVVVELRGLGECNGIGGNTTHVGAGLRVVRVDGIEQRFKCGGGETLGGLTAATLLNKEHSDGRSGGEGDG